MPRTVPRSWRCPQPGAGRPDPGRRLARRRTIATVRETELRLACERLGATHLRCWDYLDGTLAEADFHFLIGQMVQLIREFRPQVVVSFGPDGGYGQPDYITISCPVSGNSALSHSIRPIRPGVSAESARDHFLRGPAWGYVSAGVPRSPGPAHWT